MVSNSTTDDFILVYVSPTSLTLFLFIFSNLCVLFLITCWLMFCLRNKHHRKESFTSFKGSHLLSNAEDELHLSCMSFSLLLDNNVQNSTRRRKQIEGHKYNEIYV